MTHKSIYFYGNKVSDYGIEHKRVDYATLAKAFDAVLNNEIINKTYDIGYWDQESGFVDHSEEIEDIEQTIEDLENRIEDIRETDYEDEGAKADLIEGLEQKIDILRDRISELEEDQDTESEIFQYYIVSDSGAEILKEFNEIVFYNSELDMYVWGVTHWGTSWDYVLTDIVLDIEDKAM